MNPTDKIDRVIRVLEAFVLLCLGVGFLFVAVSAIWMLIYL